MSDPAAQKAFPVSWDQFHRDSRALAWRLARGWLEATGQYHGLPRLAWWAVHPAAVRAKVALGAAP
jgi:xanthine phosphoribosyltransferase